MSRKPPAKKSTTVEDLTLLVTLDEETILKALQARFNQSFIYTSTGAILLAINPFRPIDDLYTETVKEEYIENGNRRMMGEKISKLPPHVYSVADAAFRDMNRDMWTKVEKSNTLFQGMGPESQAMISKNQSILVSGESGAGKTETAKIIMNYLGSVSMATAHEGHTKDHIRNRVLESNPILEAFGNAKTNRNNNSSRFGKFIRLGFEPSGSLLGASILTYLLERVRLVSQAPGERNYHIFYELLSGASASEIAEWGLGSAESFNYLNKTGCFVRQDGVDDGESFQATKHAMTTLGLDLDEQHSVMQLVAAILHLGNIEFDAIPGDSGGSVVRSTTHTALTQAAKLLGIPIDVLEKILTTKDIQAGGDQITVVLRPDKAEVTRDVIAKIMYAELFDWLVARINESIQYTPRDAATDRFIGVVDIFGFEIFEKNSLEQLCINFANEKLQQLFSQFVFEKEQEEYVREAIPWTFVTYPNNDACVALFESRPRGLLALLDEESRLPTGNDNHLVQSFYDTFTSHEHFQVQPLQKKILQFQIIHYAGAVTYVGEGFCEKNKDHAHAEAVQFLTRSTQPLYRTVFQTPPPTSSKQPSTVVLKFKTQLASLLALLHTTEPHFIRCVKPNDQASSQIFNEVRVTEQLRCSGVLEAAKISRTGYPLRFSHAAFVHSYLCLCPGIRADPDSMRTTAQEIIAMFQAGTFMQPPNEPPVQFVDEGRAPFQVGLTKVFMVLSVYEQLNAVRETLFGSSVLDMQRIIRGWLARVQYRRCYDAILTIQSTYRMSLIRKAFHQLRNSIILIQKIVRGFVARIKYVRWKQNRAALRIQTVIRVFLAKRIVNHKRVHLAMLPVVSELTSVLEYSKQMEIEHQKSIEIQPRKHTRAIRLDEFSDDSDSDDDGIVLGDHGADEYNSYGRSRHSSGAMSFPNSYDVVVDAGGQLGVAFQLNSDRQYVVFKIHPTLSHCVEISSITIGDILVAIDGHSPASIPYPITLQTSNGPLHMHPRVAGLTSFRFIRSTTYATNDTSINISKKSFDVLWGENNSLGVSLRLHPLLNAPQVGLISHYDNPGMINLHQGDILVGLNGIDIRRMEFGMVLDLLKEAVRPLILTFDSSIDTYDSSSIALLNGSFLYHVVWDDGQLGIALAKTTQLYPKVIRINMNQGSMKKRLRKGDIPVSRGDRLVKVNHQSIRDVPYSALLQQLRQGPKPVILTFQKRKKTKIPTPEGRRLSIV